MIAGSHPPEHAPTRAEADADAALRALLAALPDDLDHLRRAATGVGDWRRVLSRAGAHGVEHALLDGLERANFRSVPAAERAAIAEQAAFERVAFEHLARAHVDVTRALDAANVPAVSLKGPALGDRIYGGVLRPSSDLDLLVAPERLDAAISALGAIGFEPDGDTRPTRWAHHVRLTKRGQPLVELHWALHSEFGGDLAAAPFLSRARRYTTRRGATTWVLAPEDELLHLAVHAAAHRCLRLGWLYDLKLFVRAHPTLDGAVIEARAKERGLASVLAFALDVTERSIGLARPRAVGALDPLRTHVAAWLSSPWAAHDGPAIALRATSFVYATLLTDSPRQSVDAMGRLWARFGARQLRALRAR
ncbi:nucleotidyltransferase family protein [Myxococcota bacterium]|nr:nucleotidyltransferase family protein [Myxococcota bacterium]